MEGADVMPGRLEAFLAGSEADAADISVTNFEPMTGGYSRVMARFDVKWCRAGRDETCSLVWRADPPADRGGFHTVRRTEFDLLSYLSETSTLVVPKVRYFCDGTFLGAPSIVMDFVPGTSLFSHLSDQDDLQSATISLATVAAAIHNVDSALLPPSVARVADSDAYLSQRIAEWATAERAHPESDPFLRYVGAWLDAHRPPSVPLTLIHGDFQTANLLVTPEGAVCVVDWEFARIGDPREDLGYFCGVASVAPPDLIGADPAAFCDRYRELTGLNEAQINPETIRYFTILGMATVLGQILEQKAVLSRGEQPSIMSYYVSNAVSYAHMQQLAIIDELDGV
jgi:aminoglycoside phosphotransferase (APT) family kinase protein